MKKPLFIVILVAVAVVIIGYSYTVFRDRYSYKSGSNSNVNSGINAGKNSEQAGGLNDSVTSDSENGNVNTNANQNENVNINSNTNSSIRDVTNKDCDSDCKRFKDNSENYKYCQEVCGDIPIAGKNSEEDCVNLTGLDKDYCLRDLAVSKKDNSFCSKISDSKLKTTCRNRVAEELLN